MKTKGLKYRFLWTWDQSMDWVPLADGIQEMGAANPYYKKPGDFVEDYRRLIDFFSPLGFTGVIIYGFLRDCHGGIDSAKEICRYGREKGMLIIPGIGINSYGGIYWEGKHEFNLSRWLDRHPELEAVGQPYPGHPYLRIACPSKEENRRWHRDAVRWLCETFEIGGVNFETGDYGLCKCEQCQRKSNRSGEWSIDDISELVPPLIAEAEKARPGILPICECYFDNILDLCARQSFSAFSENTVLQFTINRSYWPKFQKEAPQAGIGSASPHRKIIRTHMGSQWNGDRHRLVAQDFALLAKTAARSGLDGMTIFGEVSPWRVVHEINYLSAAFFADNPGRNWGDFVNLKLAPLLGGKDLAGLYLKFMEKQKVGRSELTRTKTILRNIKDPAYRRWLWMAEQIYCHMA